MFGRSTCFFYGTQNVISELSFNEALMEGERSELHLKIETLRGNLQLLESNKAKVRKMEDKKAQPGVSDDQKQEIWNDDIAKAEDERGLLVKQTQTQLTAIKNTLMKTVEGDKSLTKKLKILFKKQGITIAGIVTAVGMLTSIIVLAVTREGATGAREGVVLYKNNLRNFTSF